MFQYLLGELPLVEAERFEEKYFTDDNSFDQLLAVKSNLIDRYLHGQLDEKQTDRFESYFLKSRDHQHEVAVMRSLIELSSESEAAVNPLLERLFGVWPVWGKLVAAGLAVLLIAGSIWLLMENRRMQAELETIRAQQQTAAARELELQQRLAVLQAQSPLPAQSPVVIASPVPKTSPSPGQNSPLASFFAIALTPGQSRNDGTSSEHIVPAKTLNLHILLSLPPGIAYQSYSVALKHKNKTIHRSDLQASNDVVEAVFEANKLKPGEYIVLLSGIHAKGKAHVIADYQFRLARQ